MQKEIEKCFRETRHLKKTKKLQKIYFQVIFLTGCHQRFKRKSYDMYEKIIKIYHTLNAARRKRDIDHISNINFFQSISIPSQTEMQIVSSHIRVLLDTTRLKSGINT